MSTIQPSMESSSSYLDDWLVEAIGLVQRVNARLRRDPAPDAPVRSVCQRLVLDDGRCRELAGLAQSDLAA